jgi:hypothetical protein
VLILTSPSPDPLHELLSHPSTQPNNAYPYTFQRTRVLKLLLLCSRKRRVSYRNQGSHAAVYQRRIGFPSCKTSSAEIPCRNNCLWLTFPLRNTAPSGMLQERRLRRLWKFQKIRLGTPSRTQTGTVTLKRIVRAVALTLDAM